MNKKKILLIAGVLLAAVAAVVGILFAMTRSSGKKSVYVYGLDLVGMTDYWGDSKETYGPVRSDNIQTVMLSDTQTVTEILVKEGDMVKKGDKLLSFDTTLSDLALEKKRLAVEQLKLQLQQDQARLEEILDIPPYTPVKKDPVNFTPDYGDVVFGTGEDYFPRNTTEAVEQWLSTYGNYDGSTRDKAVILWVRQGYPITFDMLKDVAQFIGELRSRQDYLAKMAEYDAKKAAYEEYQKQVAEGKAPETEVPDPGEPPTQAEPENVQQFYVIIKSTYGNQTGSYAYVWYGLYVDLGEYSLLPLQGDLIGDYTRIEPTTYVPPEEELPDGPLYTIEDLTQMVEQQRKKILDTKYRIKVAEAEYSIAQREMDDGNVCAEVDGKVVSVLTQEEAKERQQPVVKVSGGGGFYVTGSVSELNREELAIGSEVTINDYRNGGMYTGTVQSVGDYPSSTDAYYGNGNPNVSYYPFTVFVEESADLVGGSYVNIQYSLGQAGSGIYLQNPFLRKENGESFVYVRGENGRLEKRAVQTGKSVWGSYTEILSGITLEDRIAFPYGKTVKPGAPTAEGDYSTLYEQ